MDVTVTLTTSHGDGDSGQAGPSRLDFFPRCPMNDIGETTRDYRRRGRNRGRPRRPAGRPAGGGGPARPSTTRPRTPAHPTNRGDPRLRVPPPRLPPPQRRPAPAEAEARPLSNAVGSPPRQAIGLGCSAGWSGAPASPLARLSAARSPMSAFASGSRRVGGWPISRNLHSRRSREPAGPGPAGPRPPSGFPALPSFVACIATEPPARREDRIEARPPLGGRAALGGAAGAASGRARAVSPGFTAMANLGGCRDKRVASSVGLAEVGQRGRGEREKESRRLWGLVYPGSVGGLERRGPRLAAGDGRHRALSGFCAPVVRGRGEWGLDPSP